MNSLMAFFEEIKMAPRKEKKINNKYNIIKAPM